MIARSGRRTLVLPAAIAMAIAMVPAAAFAQAAPTYAQLLHNAENAPQLAEAAADVARAQGLAEQARARPNPSISLLTENIIGTSPYSGLGRAETTVQYNHPIELGGKRKARIAAGEAGVSAAEARSRDTRIAFAYELARAYAAAEIAERRVGLAEDELEEAGAVLDATRLLVGAGREANLRSIQAESAAQVAKAEREVARANRIAAYARLSAMAGADTLYASLPESLLDKAREGFTFGTLDPTSSPAYRAAEAEVHAARLRAVSERKRARPDITGTFGVRRLETDRAEALVAGVSLPLNLFDRNKGNIAAADAEVRAAEARLALLRNDLLGAGRAANSQIAAAEARLAAAGEAQETAQETYRLARIAYDSGKSPLVELLNARHGLGEARAIVVDAEAARFDLIAQLARLQGRTVTGDMIQ